MVQLLVLAASLAQAADPAKCAQLRERYKAYGNTLSHMAAMAQWSMEGCPGKISDPPPLTEAEKKKAEEEAKAKAKRCAEMDAEYAQYANQKTEIGSKMRGILAQKMTELSCPQLAARAKK